MPNEQLIPNVLLLGNPKAGSTFLFSCLRSGPFDPNLLRGPYDAQRWRSGSYLLTTLGPKKEFNYWGVPQTTRWGWDWYLGVPAPLSAWEWTSNVPAEAGDGARRRRRRGENGNGEPNELVARLCALNGSSSKAACRRFPVECLGGTPVVRPGCALARPFPSTRGCGKPSQKPCERPKVRMSHGWPLVADASPNALAIDPSINTFMNAVDAPNQIRLNHPTASTLKFIVLLREPVARAMSSARMMHEWGWEKAANVSTALLYDLERLRQCGEGIAPSPRSNGGGGAAALSELDGAKGFEAATHSPWARAASALARLSDASLTRFRRCLAHKNPLNHVRASLYAAGVLGWLSAGFSASSFLWLETEAVRRLPADRLLTTFAEFTGLPTTHLPKLPHDIRMACERGGGGAASAGRRLSGDDRMAVHAQRALPPIVSRELHAAFKPFNELLRSLLNDVAPTLRDVTWM